MYEISGTARVKFQGTSEEEYLFTVNQNSTGKITGVIEIQNYSPPIEDFSRIERFYGTSENNFKISVIDAVVNSISINSNGQNKAHFYARELNLKKDHAKSSKM